MIGGWHTMRYLGPRLDTRPLLRHTRPWPSLWNDVKRDSSLKTWCFQCLKSHLMCILPPHTVASPVIWRSPPKSVDHLHAQKRSRDKTIAPDHSDELSVFSDYGWAVTPPTSTVPLMWPSSVSVASQNFADASLQHTQYSCHFCLRITLSQ